VKFFSEQEKAARGREKSTMDSVTYHDDYNMLYSVFDTLRFDTTPHVTDGVGVL